MATISARIDDNLKASAEQIAESIGIPLSTAINIFLKRFISEQGFPFEVKAVQAPMSSPWENVTSIEKTVKQAVADPDNVGIPESFTYFDPETKKLVTHYNRKE